MRAFVTDRGVQRARLAISAIGIVQKPVASSTASIMMRATASVAGVAMRRPTSAMWRSRCACIQNPGLRKP
jgi:hypothetical protein